MSEFLEADRFESYLRETRPEAYKYYQKVKKQSIKDGKDPIRGFRDHIRKSDPNEGDKRALKFWMLAIGKRLVEPEAQDETFIIEVLSEKNIDIDLINEALENDSRKVADVICALKLDKLAEVQYEAIYLVVEKIIKRKTKKGDKGNALPIPDVISESIPKEFLENADAYAILKKYTIEGYQSKLQKNYTDAMMELLERAENEKDPIKKKLYEEVRDYYLELELMRVPGVVENFRDNDTGEVIGFPALHQKIAAKFIVDNGRVLIADKTGVGKTATAIAGKNLAQDAEGKKLVGVAVVPNSVLGQWEKQIKFWNKENQRVEVITSGNRDEALARIERDPPDYVVVSYDMIHRATASGSVALRLSKVSGYTILDEIHQAKPTATKRAGAIAELANGVKYCVMLSATPVPNRLDDLGLIGSILNNGEYTPDDFNARYKKNPRLARQAIVQKMLRRSKSQTFGQGEVEIEVVKVKLTDEQILAHDNIMLNAENKGTLEVLINLRKCTLDPKFIGVDKSSPKYEELVKRVKGGIDGTPQIVFSSELKEGVLDRLCERFEREGLRVARIDGDPERSGSNRNVILEKIARCEYDVVVATLDTLGEGVDSLTVSNKAHFIDVPYTEAKIVQGIGRLDRKGQRRSVKITIYCGEGSIDEKLLNLTEQKKTLGQYVIDGMELTQREREIFESGEAMVSGGADDLRKMYNFFGVITERDTAEVERTLQDEKIGGFIARKYWDNFDNSFYGNTNKLIVKIIEGLEASAKKTFEAPVDIGSGPCCLARGLGRPVVSFDANPHALKLGKEALGETAGEIVVGNFKKLPFEDSRFDLSVFSLALLHSKPEERETILRGVNRISAEGAVLVLTIPNGPSRLEKLTESLPKLGFEILEQVSGLARSSDDPNYECLIVCAKKVGSPVEEQLPVELFDYSTESTRRDAGSEVPISKSVKPKKCDNFEIDGKEIAEACKATELVKREVMLEQKIENILGDLLTKYGTARRLYDEASPAELIGLGVEKYQQGNVIGIRMKPPEGVIVTKPSKTIGTRRRTKL